MKIESIHAQEILDSRGSPTIETTTVLGDGSTGRSAVPSGVSTGKHEAVELRDKDKNRYKGLGVLKAIHNVNGKIAKSLVGTDAEYQTKVDKKMVELDGTKNKSKLGANAILSVSLSVAKAQADHEKKPLYDYLTKFNQEPTNLYIMPIPEMNVINGGRHADWSTDIQEYMLFPIGAPSITEAVRMNTEIFLHLKGLLIKMGYSTTVGDEGGFAPNISSNNEPFQLLEEATRESGYKIGKDVFFGIDVAASELFQNKKYNLRKEGKILKSGELASFFNSLTTKYPIISIEDAFSEDDWKAFSRFNRSYGQDIQIVGDDLYVTNVKRLKKGIKIKATNSILIKLNQIRTLTETIDAIQLVKDNGLSTIISHRSGETEDDFIADFCVAMGCGQIKTGAPSRGERTAKYNRLMRIERELGEKSKYAKFPFEVNS